MSATFTKEGELSIIQWFRGDPTDGLQSTVSAGVVIGTTLLLADPIKSVIKATWGKFFPENNDNVSIRQDGIGYLSTGNAAPRTRMISSNEQMEVN